MCKCSSFFKGLAFLFICCYCITLSAQNVFHPENNNLFPNLIMKIQKYISQFIKIQELSTGDINNLIKMIGVLQINLVVLSLFKVRCFNIFKSLEILILYIVPLFIQMKKQGFAHNENIQNILVNIALLAIYGMNEWTPKQQIQQQLKKVQQKFNVDKTKVKQMQEKMDNVKKEEPKQKAQKKRKNN